MACLEFIAICSLLELLSTRFKCKWQQVFPNFSTSLSFSLAAAIGAAVLAYSPCFSQFEPVLIWYSKQLIIGTPGISFENLLYTSIFGKKHFQPKNESSHFAKKRTLFNPSGTWEPFLACLIMPDMIRGGQSVVEIGRYFGNLVLPKVKIWYGYWITK